MDQKEQEARTVYANAVIQEIREKLFDIGRALDDKLDSSDTDLDVLPVDLGGLANQLVELGKELKVKSDALHQLNRSFGGEVPTIPTVKLWD